MLHYRDRISAGFVKAILEIAILISGVSGFYSPVKHLQVTRLTEWPLLNGTKIAEISVLLNSSRPAPYNLNFSSLKPTNLTVNSKGEILVTGPILPGVLENMTVVAKMPHIPSVATVNVTLLLLPAEDVCSKPSPEMCFVGWIHFQVHSDAKGLEDQVQLGHIGPPVGSCKSLKAEYSLEQGEDRVRLRGDVLWVRTAALKDDPVSSDFNVTVSCSVGSTSFKRSFQVDVIPRTPWETMKQKTVRLLSSPLVEKGGGFVVSWGFFKEGSRADLVQTTNTSVYNLRMDKKVISSVITNKTLFLIHLEWSSTRNITLPMTVEAKLEVSEPGAAKEEVLLQSTLQLTNLTFPNLTYAKPLEVVPGLTQYARTSYPVNLKKWSLSPNVTFRSVLPPGLVSPFNVTRKGGIVYLTDRWRDFQRFYSNFTGVLVEWRVKSTKQLLQISWLPVEWKPTNNSCHEDPYIHGEHDMAEYLCSAAMAKRACLQMCGLAASSSSGGVCSWVPLSKTQNYTTCSTDRGFCPDNFCDPLEQMVSYICPQDCTKHVHLGSLDESGQGIAAASGHCTCDQLGNCECGTILPAPLNKMKPSDESGDKHVIQKASCDGNCILLMLTVGICIASLILTSAFFCKKSRSRRKKLKVLEDRLLILEQRIEELETENDVPTNRTRHNDQTLNFNPNRNLNNQNNSTSTNKIKRILSKRSTRKKMSNSDLLRPIGREEAVKIYCRVKSPPERAQLGTNLNNNVLNTSEHILTIDVRQNRFLFNSLRQGGTEPISQYIAKLKSLIVKCQYGGMANEILLDKIIYSVRDASLQERLRTKRGITLEEAVSICEATFC